MDGQVAITRGGPEGAAPSRQGLSDHSPWVSMGPTRATLHDIQAASWRSE